METYCSDQINELALAMIEVQKQLTPALKDGKNPFIGSHYATLNSVMISCRNLLLEHGIWLTQLPVPAPIELGAGYLGLMTKLTHAESGQWQSSLTVIPLPKADPQGMGSAITYARRYALSSMLGMITEDDDGESAKMPSERYASKPVSSQKANQSIHRKNQKAKPTHSSDLPELEGVTFQIVKGQDGRECIVASGNTQPKKEILRGMGFYWNAQRKIWWKYADAA